MPVIEGKDWSNQSFPVVSYPVSVAPFCLQQPSLQANSSSSQNSFQVWSIQSQNEKSSSYPITEIMYAKSKLTKLQSCTFSVKLIYSFIPDIYIAPFQVHYYA